MGVYWRVDQSILIFGQNFMSYYNFYCLGPFPCLRICLRICANESKVLTLCDKYCLHGERAHYQRRHYLRTCSNIIKFEQVCEKYMRHLQSAHYCQTAGSSRENLLVGQWEKEPVWFWPTIPLAVLTFCDHRHHLYLLSWVILHLHKISSGMERLPMFAKARNICANVLQYHYICTSVWR